MFKDKVFNVSFIISFCWHLACIFAFVLVVAPKGFTLNEFPTTAFLGPILEQDSFRFDYNFKPVFLVTPYKEDFAFDRDVFQQRHDFLTARSLPCSAFDKIKFKELKLEKQVPGFVSNIIAENKDVPEVNIPSLTMADSKAFKVRGDLASRRLLYRPVLPKLPEWALESSQSFSIDLKVFVSGDGVVRQVSRITTTGYTEIDLMAIKNARGLLFQPVAQYAPQPAAAANNSLDVLQEGEITIVLDAR